MGHKTLIDGTAYSLSGGKALIGGTGYNVKGGKTLVDGTGYDIGFAPGELVLYNGGADFENGTAEYWTSSLIATPQGSGSGTPTQITTAPISSGIITLKGSGQSSGYAGVLYSDQIWITDIAFSQYTQVKVEAAITSGSDPKLSIGNNTKKLTSTYQEYVQDISLSDTATLYIGISHNDINSKSIGIRKIILVP